MAKRLIVVMLVAMALPMLAQDGAPSGPIYVSEPAIPTISPAVRNLPDLSLDPNMYGLEMKRREDYGFIPMPYAIEAKTDPLLELSRNAPAPAPDAFGTPLHIYTGMTSPSSPPDTTGDVGPTYFLQGINGSGSYSTSTVGVYDKATGTNLKTFSMQSLASGSPCNSGYCDPVVLYDRMADRWIVSEFPSSGGHLCVYVSTSNDPTGTWYAYTFSNVENSTPDYPKYGVWPQNGNGGSYFVGINASKTSGKRDVVALDRAKMLAGQPATYQTFLVNSLPNSGFQLVLPANQQGKTAPPNGSPAIVMRPRDDEAQDGASTPSYDLLEMWAISVDWTTPANSTITQLTSLHMGDYDMTLCGMGNTWNCMPQPGTNQKIDPIREPVHFPLQYRNFGDHEAIVGCFVEDVDGTDHAALRWFEVRKAAGAWSLFQEGVVGGDAQHRSIGSTAMDGSGNIAIGYTRTGASTPYYPSIYFKGRLASDPSGTMPQGEFTIFDATTSKTNNERYGDYAGIGVDPTDDCTFWFTTEYGGSGQTKIASFKFDACGCLSVPAAPDATISAPTDNRIDVSWNDSATVSITQYFVYRSLVAGGPYALLATVADTSPGLGGGTAYTYHDDTVSGGTTYYYTVKSNDGVACTSPASSEVSIPATGSCLLPPSFAGITSVTNSAAATCTLALSWSTGTPACAGPLRYNIYRSTTTGFTPAPANRIASGFSATSYVDVDQLVSGTAYYYIVRAVDLSNSVEETNTTEKSGTPSGPASTSTITETFEGAGGFDNAGWTHSAISGTVDWVWSTAGNPNTPTRDWFSPSQGSVSDRALVSPSFGVIASTTIRFYHTYNFEGTSTCYDGGTVETSTDGGAIWTVVPDADFTGGGFNGTVSASFSNPIGGKRAYCFGTVGTMVPVNINLGGDTALVGKTIKVRWHEGDDSSSVGTGWYVDSVTITNAGTASACATGTGCTPPGAPTLISATGTCTSIDLSWTAGTGTTLSYNIYRSTTSGSGYAKLPASPVTGTSFSDNTATPGTTYYYVIKGCCDTGGVSESVISNEKSAARLAIPAAPTAGNNGPICAGATLNLTASTMAGASYAWTGPNDFASSVQNPSITNSTTTASGTYSVTATVGGCTSSAATTTATVTVCAPNVQYDGAFDPVTSLTEICGNHDAVVDPGEQWLVTVRLKNTGNLSATNTVATLAVNGGSAVAATVFGNPGSFGTIGTGGTATAPYQFLVSSGATCVKNLTFDVAAIQSSEGSYPEQPAAFAIAVGSSTGETGNQQTTPLNSTSSTSSSNITPAFTISSPDTSTMSYSGSYAQKPGGTAMLFGPDDMTTLSNWTGGSAQSLAGHCSHSNAYDRIAQNSYTTLTNPISTVGYSNIHVKFDAGISNSANTVRMDWYDGTTWTQGWTFTGSVTWQCNQDVALPAGAAGKAGFKIRFYNESTATKRYGRLDYVSITGDGAGAGSWTENARVSFVDPSSAVTILKAYGVADGSPYDVKAYYTGPGMYQIRLEENNGGTATITAGSMVIGKVLCNASACGTAPLEIAPGTTFATAQSWSDKSTHTWPADSAATSYTLYRGIQTDLLQLRNGSTDSCTKYTGAANSTDKVTEDPTGIAGGFYWYIVTGSNSSGEGPSGNATGGTRTVNSSGTCP